jgi:putative transposase
MTVTTHEGPVALAKTLAARGRNVRVVELLLMQEAASTEFLAVRNGWSTEQANRMAYATVLHGKIDLPNAAARTLTACTTNVIYLDKYSIFCNDVDHTVRLYDRDNRMLFADGSHLTGVGLAFLGRRIAELACSTALRLPIPRKSPWRANESQRHTRHFDRSHDVGWSRVQNRIRQLQRRKIRRTNRSPAIWANCSSLVRENANLMRQLLRTEAILDFQKKSLRDPGDRVAAKRLRQRTMKAVEDLAPAMGTSDACAAVGVPRATAYRHCQPKAATAPKPRPAPPRALSGEECQQALDVHHSEPFADHAPAETYAKLLDHGTYLCSIRTMYRALKANHEIPERRKQLQHPAYAKPQLVATAPNQVWTWDITKLLGPAKWTYYCLYVILDIYSWYVLGWMLAHRESQHLAGRLIRETLVNEGIHRDQLTIHSERSPAKRFQAVAQLLATLGVTNSHSRPDASDDKPFSECQFKTLKYRPDVPDRFADFDHGLDFCRRFFNRHNEKHCHWGIGLLTPAVVHTSQATAAIASRASVLTNAHARHPERFVHRLPRPPSHRQRSGSTRPRTITKFAHWNYRATVNLFRRCPKVIDTFRGVNRGEVGPVS